MLLPSWIPFPAALLAVGISAAGVAPAAADPAPELPGTSADPTAHAPVHTCQPLHETGRGLEAAPCLDTDLGVRVPNPARDPALASTVGTLRDATRDSDPLPQVVGGVLSSQAVVNSVAKTRPTVDIHARPDYPGVLEPRRSTRGLLGAEVGPHQPKQDGASAVDTAAQIDAAHGYDLRPGTGVLGAAKPLIDPLRNALTG